MDIFTADDACLMHTYRRFPVAIVEGRGAIAVDADGREYIDLGSGIGVNALGYCDPDWSEAVSAQTAKLSHTSNLYYSEPQVELAQKLTAATGYARVFFGNSGAEANEGAIKLARKYSFDKYGAGRSTVLTLVNSFHGRTVTTLAATGQDVFHQWFEPFTPGFKYCAANDLDALDAALTDDVCAIMFEFVQGEGGVVPLEESFVKGLFARAAVRDIVTIADEVQTGIGRTGEFLASQAFGVLPDVTTLAKGLGGGLPIGAVLASEKLKDVLGVSQHGSTFGGNPIVCAGACVVLDRVADGEFLAAVKRKGAYVRAALAGAKGVESVTGRGLMIGIRPTFRPAAEIVREALGEGLLLLTAKDKVRLLPPLSIDDETLSAAVAKLKTILAREG